MINTNKRFKLPRNPFLLFLPFFFLYVVIVLYFSSTGLWGDESRYVGYAQNLLHGFYSGPEIDLSNGPGYPLVILPLLALKLPWLVIKLMNSVFYYLSVVFLFKTIRIFGSFKMAVIASVFWACYYNAYENLPFMLTETLGIFLISSLGLVLSTVFGNTSIEKKTKYIYLSGFLIGYIALTKVVFGYVIVVMLIIFTFLWLLNKKNKDYKHALIISLVSIVTIAPYLAYTYSLTGRFFYWTTNSGNNLYWMTTPYQGEYGDWFKDPDLIAKTHTQMDESSKTYNGSILNMKNRVIPFQEKDSLLKMNHGKDFQEVFKYKTPMEQDDVFKRIAISNIRSYPKKFLINWISNVGRILFNYPFSYKPQTPLNLLRFPMSGIIVVLTLFCSIFTIVNWKKINFSIKFIVLFSFIYLGGSSLGSSETRMLTMVVPIMLIWIAYILHRTVKIKMNWQNSD